MPKPMARHDSPTPTGRHVFLIGFRAAGKSTVGRLVASALEVPFVDLDEVVAAEGGKSAGDLLLQEGERRFREREEAALRGLQTAEPSLVATGGGVVEREASRHLLRTLGSCLWLDPPLSVIKQRLEADPHRPALGGGSAIDEAEALLRRRRPWYESLASERWKPDSRERSVAGSTPLESPVSGDEKEVLGEAAIRGLPVDEVRRLFAQHGI